VFGVLTVLFDVADQTFLPQVVGKQDLVRANSRLIAIDSVAGVVGPGAGGVLINLITAPLAVIVGVVGYVWSAGCVLLIRVNERKPARARKPDLVHEIREGVHAIMADPLLRPLVLCSTTQTFFWSMAYTMLLVLLAGNLHTSAALIGLLLTVGSSGAIIATALVRRVNTAIGDANAVKLGMLLAPSTLLAPLVEPGWRLWLVAVSSFALNAGIVLYNVAQVSFRQRRVPDELLGRVNATVRFFAWGARPVGSLCGGAVAEYLGVRTSVWIGAIGTSLAFLWLYLSPLCGMRELPSVPEGADPAWN